MENQNVVKADILENRGEWYALRCKSNMEFIVDHQLSVRNITRYLPTYPVTPVNSRSRRTRPYFPGYLFLQGKTDDFFAQRVFLLRGVIGLVSFDGIPAPIQPGIIESVRRQTHKLDLELQLARSGFTPGDEVFVQDSALGQLEGIFEKCINGQERVSVLLKLMQGNMMRVEVPVEKVRRKH